MSEGYMMHQYLFKLPIAQIIKDIYEQQSLTIKDIALHLGCTIRKIKLIEIQENLNDVYTKEQVNSLVKFLDIKEVELSKEKIKHFKQQLSMWREKISQGKLGAAARHLEECSLHEITYLPFDYNLIMHYEMFNIKFILARRDYDLAERLLSEIEVKKLSVENKYHYYYNFGTLHIYKKKYDAALKFFTKAYETEFIDDKGYEHSLHYNLGLCYTYLGMSLRAVLCLEQADKLLKRDNASLFPICLDNVLAVNYMRLGELHLSKKRIVKSLGHAKTLKNKEHIGIAIHNLGCLSMKEKEFDRALEYFNKELEFIEEGEREHYENLFYKILCRIMSDNSWAKSDLSYATKLAQNRDDKEYSALFESLSHLLSLEEESSVEYIETVTIPSLMEKHDYQRILYYYQIMESFFSKNGNKTKVLEINLASYNLFKIMIQGGRTYDKKIDWPDVAFSHGI